jgi:hypothetical protein
VGIAAPKSFTSFSPGPIKVSGSNSEPSTFITMFILDVKGPQWPPSFYAAKNGN